MELTLGNILSARARIAGSVVRTPLLPSSALTARAGAPVFLKMESMQPTGGFKLRGPTNAAAHVAGGIDTLTCCSTGNHGSGVAHAAARMELNAVIFMSALVPQTKIDGIKALGAEVRITGTSQDDALAACQELAQQENVAELSPFDDPHVVVGQGINGLEVLEDVPDLATLACQRIGDGNLGTVIRT
jgi:threonine dehydratase